MNVPEATVVDSLGDATPETEFNVFNAGGTPVRATHHAGPGFILTEPTQITHIGGFLNVCIFENFIPVCPGGNLPLVVEIHPAGEFGDPDPPRFVA